VVERVDGALYTFLRLETDKGQVWVAVPMADVPKTSKVTVKNGAVLKAIRTERSSAANNRQARRQPRRLQ
jgi:hypothetical protein